MQLLHLAAFIFPATLVAAAKTSGLCTKSTSIVDALENPTGSSFCASLLDVPSTTVTTTSTVTPHAVTVTRTTRTTDRDATVTRTRTRRTIVKVTNVVTTQSTTETTTRTSEYTATAVNCISNTDQLQPYTSTIIAAPSSAVNREELNLEETVDDLLNQAQGTALQGRDEAFVAPAPLKGESRRRRRAFCSCLEPLSPNTITSTERTTVVRPTSTVTETSTVSAKTITRTTVTNTLTRTIQSTATLEPATSTVTIAVITPIVSNYPGVNYYAFHNNLDYYLPNAGFEGSFWNSNDYALSGTIEEINNEHTFNYPFGGTSCVLPDGNVILWCSQVTFVNQGYFHATEDGVYTIGSTNDIDNGMYVWSGEVAYDSYSNDNADYFAQRQGTPPVTTAGSKEYNLNAGDLVPFTIMNVNGGSVGRANIYVTTPGGGTYGTQGFFIPACPNSNPFSP